MNEDELYHYGVKGQKWGVRRTKAQLGYKTTSSKNKKANSFIKSYVNKRKTSKKKKVADEKTKKKSISEMSDAELRERISRLQMEKQYKDLLQTSKPQTFNGKKFVVNILEKSGENLATQVVNHYGATALNKIIGQEVIYANNKKKA